LSFSIAVLAMAQPPAPILKRACLRQNGYWIRPYVAPLAESTATVLPSGSSTVD
jgi:hypothetical protein